MAATLKEAAVKGKQKARMYAQPFEIPQFCHRV
jgi:hypothetical protein